MKLRCSGLYQLLGWTTVLTDPQGATFIASQFVLENKDFGSEADATARAA